MTSTLSPAAAEFVRRLVAGHGDEWTTALLAEYDRLAAEVAILQKTVARLTKALDEASDLLARALPT